MRVFACLIALLLAIAPAAAQERKEVDLVLALAIDISGSIDPEEARLQRRGYVQAFRDREIVKAILGGANGRVAVAYFEWSDSWILHRGSCTYVAGRTLQGDVGSGDDSRTVGSVRTRVLG